MKGADEIIRRKIIGKDEKNAQKGGDFCRGPNLQSRGNGKVVLETRQEKRRTSQSPRKHRVTNGRDMSIVSNENRVMIQEKRL